MTSSFTFVPIGHSKSERSVFLLAKIRNAYRLVVSANMHTGEAVVSKVSIGKRFKDLNITPGELCKRLRDKLEEKHDFIIKDDDLSLLGVSHLRELTILS